MYKARLEKKRTLGRYKARISGPRQKEIQEDDGVPKLNIVLKGDVAGSVEAILDVFDTYTDEDRCRLHIVHYGVGPLTESEVELAKAFEGKQITPTIFIHSFIQQNCSVQCFTLLFDRLIRDRILFQC